jgi:hypothetical protein
MAHSFEIPGNIIGPIYKTRPELKFQFSWTCHSCKSSSLLLENIILGCNFHSLYVIWTRKICPILLLLLLFQFFIGNSMKFLKKQFCKRTMQKRVLCEVGRIICLFFFFVACVWRNELGCIKSSELVARTSSTLFLKKIIFSCTNHWTQTCWLTK